MDMMSFDNVVQMKKDRLPDFISVMKKLFNGNDFDVIPNYSYSIISIIPHNTVQMKMEPFSVYWGLNPRDKYIDFKTGKDTTKDYSKYKWNVVLNNEVKYIVEGNSLSYFHLIKVDKSLSERLTSIVKQPNYTMGYIAGEGLYYNRICLSDISEWILYSTLYPKPTFTGSMSNNYEKTFIINTFHNILSNYEKQGKWAVKNMEILHPAENILRKKFFIPLNKEGHYYSLKLLDNIDRTIFQNDLWNYLKACYTKWNYINAVKITPRENLYYWNKKLHAGNVPENSIEEFEGE